MYPAVAVAAARDPPDLLDELSLDLLRTPLVPIHLLSLVSGHRSRLKLSSMARPCLRVGQLKLRTRALSLGSGNGGGTLFVFPLLEMAVELLDCLVDQ